MAVTKHQAMTHTEFHSLVFNNADGTPERWRSNGRCKVWKTRPDEFSLPVKRGMYQFGYIDNNNAMDYGVGYYKDDD